MSIEEIALAFQWLCFVLMILSGLRAVVFNMKPQNHLKVHHTEKWREFLGEGTELVRNIYLKPMNSDKSYFSFLVRSADTLGDQQVSDYRRHVRAGAVGFIINVIAGFISFMIRGVFQS